MTELRHDVLRKFVMDGVAAASAYCRKNHKEFVETCMFCDFDKRVIEGLQDDI